MVIAEYQPTSPKRMQEPSTLQNNALSMTSQTYQRCSTCGYDISHIASQELKYNQLLQKYTRLLKYCESQKLSLTDMLWENVVPHHPELQHIPILEKEGFPEKADQVGTYMIGEVLGEGSFSTVASCNSCIRTQNPNSTTRRTRKSLTDLSYNTTESRRNNYEMAVKIINKSQVKSLTAVLRLSKEIEILKVLESHPLITSFIDAKHTISKIYIFQEKGGKDLFEFMDNYPCGIPFDWATTIIKCLLQAISYCHERGICHRDLKPENILMDFDCELDHLKSFKLCDFGLAEKFVTSDKMECEGLCGSKGFFAPEMFEVVYDGDKADIWSTGCVVLELCLGSEVFSSIWMKAYQDSHIHVKDSPMFLREVKRALINIEEVTLTCARAVELQQRHFETFLFKMLVLNPSDRVSARNLLDHENFFKDGESPTSMLEEKPVKEAGKLTRASLPANFNFNTPTISRLPDIKGNQYLA